MVVVAMVAKLRDLILGDHVDNSSKGHDFPLFVATR